MLLPSKNKEMKCRVNNVVDVTCNYTMYDDQTLNTVKYLEIYGFCQ